MPPALPQKRYEFDPGYATSRGTIGLMVDLVRRQHHHPQIIALARSIVAHVAPMDIDGEIAAVWDFVLERVRYVRDPIGAEHITEPVTMAELIERDGFVQEDCESVALFAATLLAALGIPSDFETQGRRPERPLHISHCALDVINPRNKQRTSFDPIGAWEFPGRFDLGDTLHIPGEPRQRFSVFTGKPSLLGALFDDGAGLLGDSASQLSTIKEIGQPIAQGVAQLGPVGAVVGGLFQVGTAIAGSQIKPSQPAAPAAPAKRRRSLSELIRSDAGMTTPAKVLAARAEEAERARGGKSSNVWPWLLALGVGLAVA